MDASSITIRINASKPYPAAKMSGYPPTTASVFSVESAGNVPCPPNPTPVGEAARDVSSTLATDLNAVNRTLEPITEELNLFADEANLPNAPNQTPIFSPAASVVGQLHQNRPPGDTNAGMRSVNARLGQIKLEDRFSWQARDSHNHSNQSVLSAEESAASINVALGSPNNNPRITEYLTYPASGAESPGGKKGDGVTEQSYWAEEVMGDLERACLRLEQLAHDESVVSGVPAQELYMARLRRVLAAPERKFPASWLSE